MSRVLSASASAMLSASEAVEMDPLEAFQEMLLTRTNPQEDQDESVFAISFYAN